MSTQIAINFFKSQPMQDEAVGRYAPDAPGVFGLIAERDGNPTWLYVGYTRLSIRETLTKLMAGQGDAVLPAENLRFVNAVVRDWEQAAFAARSLAARWQPELNGDTSMPEGDYTVALRMQGNDPLRPAPQDAAVGA